MKNRIFLFPFVFLAIFVSCSSDSDDDMNIDPTEDWETINDDYTYVYNISNYESTLHITGLKDGNFIFASSEDDGENWNEVVLNEDISLENGIPICVGFINSQEGFIGVKGSFAKQYLKTDDGGMTWENFDINLNEDCGNIPQPQEIVVIDESTLVLSQFQSGNYIISRDGGESWDCRSGFSVVSSPKFKALNATNYLNYDQTGIFESSDKGAVWNSAVGIEGLSTYEMYDTDRGYAVTIPLGSNDSNPQLYTTNDTWSTFETNPVPSLSGKLVVCLVPVSSEDLYFFESENVYFSDDSGATASLVQFIGFEPTHSKKVNGEWYVTGRGLARYNP